MKRVKNLDYYLGLDYEITIRRIPDDMGGGYQAFIKDLGEDTCVSDGDTPEEAVSNLMELKKWLFETWLKDGQTIPEPRKRSNLTGRFSVRVPVRLHETLVEQARENNVSLNEYVVYLLTRAVRDTHKTTGEPPGLHTDMLLPEGLWRDDSSMLEVA